MAAGRLPIATSASAVDTISGAGQSGVCEINLNQGTYLSRVTNAAGQYTNFGGYTIAYNTVIENAVGGNGNDRLTGNVANNALVGNAGNNTLSCGAGNDTLLGGAGNNVLDGGAGIDRFVWGATSLIGPGLAAGGADRIIGGVGDRIDFTAGLESALKVGGVALGAAANIALGSRLTANTNVCFDGVNDWLQIDLNGDGAFSATQDFRIELPGINTVPYAAALDLLLLA